MKRVQVIAVFAAAVLMAQVCLGQAAPGKTPYTFHGKVESVDESAKSLKVNGEEVKGWMADQITATVYDGDLTLHKVQVMSKAGGSTSKK